MKVYILSSIQQIAQMEDSCNIVFFYDTRADDIIFAVLLEKGFINSDGGKVERQRVTNSKRYLRGVRPPLGGDGGQHHPISERLGAVSQ